MSSNPYAPPTAHVADVDPSKDLAREQVKPLFFPVSLLKLTVLSICTLSAYQVYWFYKNWHLIRAREGTDIIPVMRGLFAIFFCHSCFRRIRDQGMSSGVAPPLFAGALATTWIVATLASRLPDPYWLISYASFVLLLPVQAHVNRINLTVAPGHDPNARFTGWNWFGVIVGFLLLLLVIAGLMLPNSDP